MSGMTSSTATVAVPAAGLPQPTVTVTAAPVTVSAAPITISAAPVTVTAAPITVIETPAAAPSSRVAQFAPSQPEPEPEPETDPRFSSCKEALANGYGHYREGIDPEHDWYRDGDNDGIVCE